MSVSFTPLSKTGWVATATSSSGTNLPANVLDDDLTTYWLSSGTVSQSLTIDMGAAQSFDTVELQSQSGSTAGAPIAVTILGSNDNTTFTSLFSASWAGTSAPVYLQGSHAANVAAPVYNYRYVKITVTTAFNQTTTQIGEANIGSSAATAVTARFRGDRTLYHKHQPVTSTAATRVLNTPVAAGNTANNGWGS